MTLQVNEKEELPAHRCCEQEAIIALCVHYLHIILYWWCLCSQEFMNFVELIHDQKMCPNKYIPWLGRNMGQFHITIKMSHQHSPALACGSSERAVLMFNDGASVPLESFFRLRIPTCVTPEWIIANLVARNDIFFGVSQLFFQGEILSLVASLYLWYHR